MSNPAITDSETAPRVFDVTNAATGAVITSLTEMSPAEVDAKVALARTAFEGWSRETPKVRADALFALCAELRAHGDELIELEVLNTGRSRVAAAAELEHMVDSFSFYAGAARTLSTMAAGEYVRDHTSFIKLEPVGVCGQITPWNYPMMMAGLAIAPAIAAGNCSIIKPSEVTPLSTIRLVEIASRVLPENVMNVVIGSGRVTGDALVTHDDVDLVSLIGSRRAGEQIAGNAASTMKKLHLELGGKAPVVVFPGVDMPFLVSRLLEAGFNNAGQDCTAASRVILHRSIQDEFLRAMTDALRVLKVGGPDEDAAMGPLISAQHLEKVIGMIEGAKRDGAEIVHGGSRLDREGYFIEPTLISNVQQNAEIVQQEVFGPVLTVQAFDDEQEAIEMANGVQYDLAGSVWSGSPGQLFRVAGALNFGTVWMNDHFPQAIEVPHGGLRYSGHGKDQSTYSLDSYLRVKHLMINTAL